MVDRRRKLFFTILIFIGAAFVAGGGAVYHEARKILAQPVTSWTTDHNADCAVVLTGAANRLREGLDLLAHRSVQKLIISGANPSSSFYEMFPNWPFYGSVDERDVLIERRSTTTYGNAQQTLALVEALHCRDLVIITSRTHMRRAMRTFRAVFPVNFPLYDRSVVSGSLNPSYDEIFTETLRSLFYSIWAY